MLIKRRLKKEGLAQFCIKNEMVVEIVRMLVGTGRDSIAFILGLSGLGTVE